MWITLTIGKRNKCIVTNQLPQPADDSHHAGRFFAVAHGWGQRSWARSCSIGNLYPYRQSCHNSHLFYGTLPAFWPVIQVTFELQTFTQAIFNLATRPEYIEPFWHEAEEVLQLYGWNKIGMSELPKMDSFFKESIRLNGLGSSRSSLIFPWFHCTYLFIISTTPIVGFPWITLQDYTFSDGSSIPSGSYVSAAISATHIDKAYYKNAKMFDGYWHIGKSSGKHSMSITSLHYIAFGHGKHACSHTNCHFSPCRRCWSMLLIHVQPGRFIVAYILKAMMTHLLVNYDIKMENQENGHRIHGSAMPVSQIIAPSKSSSRWNKGSLA